MPEIKLGLLPGAGGTQRLPRAIRPADALSVMADGEPRSGEEGIALGMADRLTGSEDLLATAIGRAKALAKAGGRKRLRDASPDPAERAAFEAAAVALLTSRASELQIEAIVQCVRDSFETGINEGMPREWERFLKLLQDDRSKAMRYAFFAESQSARATKGVSPSAVQRVAVIGGGMMGAGIAMSFANAGIPATVVETDEAAATSAARRIAESYEHSVRRGSLTESAKKERLDRVVTSAGMSATAGADLVIEAVFEEMDVKKQIFAQLDASARDDAILATNTFYLDVDEIAASTGRPERVLGMHFFNPANVMKLVKVVRGRATSEVALAAAVEVARRIGKIPVVVGVCHGFVGNRMLSRRSEQVERLLLEGASPEEVDRALTEFGFKMGPCAMSDLAGLDISWRMRRATGKVAPVADAVVQAGRLGQKIGNGFFATPKTADVRLPIRGRCPAAEHIRTGGHRAPHVPQPEILELLLLPMVNEGARILEEGIAARAGDTPAERLARRTPARYLRLDDRNCRQRRRPLQSHA